MAKMVLQELMEPFIFAKFKSFFTKVLFDYDGFHFVL